MHKAPCIAFLAPIAAIFFATSTVMAEENAKEDGAAKAVIVGNPPADSPFGRLKIGMKYEEVLNILGKPTSEQSYCTGKNHIPFYGGDDLAYTEYYYRGQGKVYFYTYIKTPFIPFMVRGTGACTPTTPFALASIEYNPSESGIVPRENDKEKKEPAAAAQ